MLVGIPDANDVTDSRGQSASARVSESHRYPVSCHFFPLANMYINRIASTRRHPDKNAGDAAHAVQEFTRIAAAYQRLCDPDPDDEYADCTVAQVFTEQFFEECVRRGQPATAVFQLCVAARLSKPLPPLISEGCVNFGLLAEPPCITNGCYVRATAC